MTDHHTKDTEMLLRPEEKRTNLFPIRYPHIWEWYKKAFSSLWVVGDVDLSKDKEDWDKLTDSERHFVSMVLAFFANADGIVCDNLAERFGIEVQIREAKMFYDLQKVMENVHNEQYSILIDTYISDVVQKDKLLHAVEHFPCIQKKAAWATKWIDSSESFATRLIAFAVVEGIFFSGSFCAIYWIKTKGLLPGLCFSNALISRDEAMHQDFAVDIYNTMIKNKLPEDVVYSIVEEAVTLEMEFCCEALPVSLIGMCASDMSKYIKFVADRLLTQLGLEKKYNTENPFAFMDMISLTGKTNFFENRVAEYSKTGVDNADRNKFELDAVF